MSVSRAPQFDVERLVRLVLNDLGRSPIASRVEPIAPRVEPVAVPPCETASPAKRRENPVPNAVAALDARIADEVTVAEKVITVEVIHRYESTGKHRWLLVPGAFLTPAAKDELRSKTVELVRGGAIVGGAIVGGAIVGGNGNANGNTNTRGAVPGVPTAKAVETRNESFVLAVHTADRQAIAPAFVAWIEETYHPQIVRNACIMQTTEILRQMFAEDPNRKGLVLTRYTALALLLANRCREFRACPAENMARLQREAPLLGANLLVADADAPVFPMRLMTKWFLEQGALTEPPFLTAALR